MYIFKLIAFLFVASLGITAHINEALQKPPESRQASLFVSERKDIRFGYREVETLVELLAKEGVRI